MRCVAYALSELHKLKMFNLDFPQGPDQGSASRSFLSLSLSPSLRPCLEWPFLIVAISLITVMPGKTQKTLHNCIVWYKSTRKFYWSPTCGLQTALTRYGTPVVLVTATRVISTLLSFVCSRKVGVTQSIQLEGSSRFTCSLQYKPQYYRRPCTLHPRCGIRSQEVQC